jgi:hypothetical protein
MEWVRMEFSVTAWRKVYSRLKIISHQAVFFSDARNTYCHGLVVTINGNWIANRIYWTLQTRKYNSLWRCRQFTYFTVHWNIQWIFSVCYLLSSPLVTDSNGGRSPFPEFSNCPRASATANLDPQWTQLELSSIFTITNSPIIVTNWADFTVDPSHMTWGGPNRNHRSRQFPYCFATIAVAMETSVESSLSSNRCICHCIKCGCRSSAHGYFSFRADDQELASLAGPWDSRPESILGFIF